MTDNPLPLLAGNNSNTSEFMLNTGDLAANTDDLIANTGDLRKQIT